MTDLFNFLGCGQNQYPPATVETLAKLLGLIFRKHYYANNVCYFQKSANGDRVKLNEFDGVLDLLMAIMNCDKPSLNQLFRDMPSSMRKNI